MLSGPNGEVVEGVVRVVAPTVDPLTRNALVYVDLPAGAARKVSAGMFARGVLRLGQTPALVLPQSAVLLREGFSYVFLVEGDKVVQMKVVTGRRSAEQIEVSGVDARTQVVASGVGFLADGDNVRIVSAPAASSTKP
jgi:multidrug efflux pump subunit AcrA (membrane-fusion protein)